MKRALLILLAAASVASAQTYITVTAETNRAIRTNFSLVRSQVSDLSQATFAISNITGLQTNLDAKLSATGSAAGLTNFPSSLLTTNGSASGLTNFPASVLSSNGNAAGLTNFPSLLLRTNGDASTLTNFPASLLRTNGDGGGLTNLPNANLSNAIGVLPLANGGTGSTNQSDARSALGLGTAAVSNATAFQLASSVLTNLATNNGGTLTNLAYSNSVGFGTAATNDSSAFQPSSANLTNLANNNAAALTNFPAELLRTNGNAAALTNFPSSLLRTNGDGGGLTNVSVDLTAVLPAYTNNAGKVLAVATGATNVEWIAVSNTVTDAGTLTNWPSYLLQTNGSAAFLTNFPSELLRTNGSAAGLTSFPTFNQNTTGTASNVTGVVAIANGGTSASDLTNARINLLPSYSGNAQRVLALNSNATDLIWAVDGGGQANLTNVTNTLAIANGGTGGTNALQVFTNLGILGSSWIRISDTSTNAIAGAVVIGQGTTMSGGGNVIIGNGASGGAGSGFGGVGIGRSVQISNSGIAFGYNSRANSGGISIGYGATNTAGGIQLGTGNLTNSDSIQLQSAGAVDTNEWSHLATLSASGKYAMTNTAAISTNRTFVSYDGTNYVTNSVTISNGLITGWTQ